MENSTIIIIGDCLVARKHLEVQLAGCHLAFMEKLDKTLISDGWRYQRPRLVVLGRARDGSWDTLAAARQIRQFDQRIPLIVVFCQSSEEQAIAALRTGVNDYFKPPVTCTKLVASINHHLIKLKPPAAPLAVASAPEQPMVSGCPCMEEIKTYLLKVAATDSNVLITGETGTGKELAAEFIHKSSPRRDHPFISINCAAIPDELVESELFGYEKGAFTGAHAAYAGKLKLAEGGTVFLDEISDMSPCAQAKILRAIERKEIYRLGGKQSIPVDFRVIAATNQELENLLPDQKFRKDLFFRLNVARIRVPPLRDRKEDIPLLLNHYLQVVSHPSGRTVKGFSEEALACLLRYEWPGNVRELKNLVEALLINLTSSWISLHDLPEALQKFATDGSPSERERLLSALYATHWNKSKAAQKLNWSRMTLYRKMARYQIQALGAATEPEGPTVTPSPEL